MGGTEAFALSGALVLLDATANTGGTKGTTVNHLGFQVPRLREAIERVRWARPCMPMPDRHVLMRATGATDSQSALSLLLAAYQYAVA